MTFNKGRNEKNMSIYIIIKKEDDSFKYILIIRKLTGKSISEIKEAIENENPVFKCESFRKGESRKLLETIVRELINQGAKLRIIKEENKNIEEIPVENLLNRINRFKEILQDNQKLDDLIYAEE